VSLDLFVALAGAGAAVGALHSLAPDHWVPIAAVGRAQGWSTGRTARVAAFCGFGHVTVSVALGLAALISGRELLETFGRRMESVAGLLLVGFGVAYAVWGLRHSAAHLHGHHHHHYDHVHDPGRSTAWSLLALYAVDPCVAVIPIMMAAAPLPWPAVLALVLIYELATVGAMVGLSALARAGAGALRGRFVERWSHAAAGAVIAAVGILVGVLGI
jgi:putative Mn2+ efflux pump MntP